MITGASGGLGVAVVEAFLSAGAEVVGVSRKASKPAGPRHVPFAADLTTDKGCRSAVAAAFTRSGRIDAVVHLLGAFAGGSPVGDTTDETWDAMMDVNLRPAFRVFRAALPHMIEKGYGRILAVGSRTGEQPAATLSAYNVSKAGLEALVRTAAAEVKGTGVTCNIVLPSVIDTPANRQAMPDADPGKWVKPASIAALLLWLASDAAADVNGAAIPIYGQA